MTRLASFTLFLLMPAAVLAESITPSIGYTGAPADHNGQNCSACHGEDGKGNVDMGSANLTTKVWLYGNDLNDLIYTIANARNSTMPAWGKRLDPETIKSLAVYVHSLGGGQ